MFNEDESITICSKPISRVDAVDKLSWCPSKDDKFSMKSAYYMEKTKNKKAQGESSNREHESNFWQVIWHINVPNIVKHLFW